MPGQKRYGSGRDAASILFICLSLALAAAAASHCHLEPSHHTCTVCQLSQTIDAPPDVQPAVAAPAPEEWREAAVSAVAVFEALRDHGFARAPPEFPLIDA